MRTIAEELRYGLRQLRNHPAFTLVAVLTLGIGIAANTTVFRWMDSVIVNPMSGVADASSLYALETVTQSGEVLGNTSWTDYLDYRRELRSVSGIAVARYTVLTMGEPGRTQRLWGELVSGNYFDLLGVEMVAGRNFSPEEREDTPLSAPVVIISHRLWQEQFGGRSNAIGKTLRVNLRELTVVGVAPDSFRGSTPGLAYDVWIPLTMAPAMGTGGGTLGYRGTRDLTSTLVRLQPGSSLAAARGELRSLADELARVYPETNRGIQLRLSPIAEAQIGAQRLLRGPLRILMAVCAVLLLLVCANVANLLLVRFLERRRELSIRLAMGAPRARLLRQLLSETLLVAVGGALLGALLSSWMENTLLYLLPPNDAPIRFGMPWHSASLLFTVGICFGATLLCGMAPAVVALRQSVRAGLNENTRGSSDGTGTGKLRAFIVATEVALATVALIATGLFVESFRNASATHPGFRTENVVVGNFFLTPLGYSGQQQRDYCRRLTERLRTSPGIIASAYVDQVPLQLGASPWHQIQVEGYTPAEGEDMNVHRSMVSPGFFSLMDIRLLEGRDFTAEDRTGKPEVIIVNQAFAERFFGDANPVGRRIALDGGKGNPAWRTIVGVVANSKVHSVAESPTPYFYRPFQATFSPGLNFSFLVRHHGGADTAIATLRREALAVDRNASVANAMPLLDSIGNALYPQKVAATLLSGLGVVALLLAALGLFGVMSYAVAQRTREIAIRMALGARHRQVLQALLHQTAWIVCAGVGLGVAISVLGGDLARPLLVGVEAADLRVFAGAVGMLVAAALAANVLPAWRATRIHPATALRSGE